VDGEDGSLHGIADKKVVLVTAHRRESWGPAMEAVGRALATIAGSEPGVEIVFPIHRNPRVREAILPAVEGLSNVRLLEPMSYAPFAHLMRQAHIILTDSGGIQEEGPSLGKPVLVMRDTTERPEALTAGTVRLVGTDEHAIAGAVRTLLHDDAAYQAMADARSTPSCTSSARARPPTSSKAAPPVRPTTPTPTPACGRGPESACAKPPSG